MKTLVIAMLAALALAPVTGFGEDAAGAAEVAKPRKKLQLKAQGYTDINKAKAEAMKYEVPILTVVLLDGDEKSAIVKKYMLSNKAFKAFTAENCTLLIVKGKKAKDGKTVDLLAFRKMREFIEANVMDEAIKDNKNKPEDLRFYPTAFLMTSNAEKKLVHLPTYNPELGFGAWAMELTAKLDQAGVKPVISPALKKLMEDPQPDIKAPRASKKK